MIRKICIISQRYPSIVNNTVHVFVQKLAWAMSDLGVDVTIISPVAINEKNTKIIEKEYIETTLKGNKIKVYRPRYFYLGQKIRYPIKLSHISENNFYNSCVKVIRENNIDPDLFYGHFICLAGITAARLGRRFNKPSFFAYGESSDWSIKNYGIKSVRKELKNINGVVAVSTNNKKSLINLDVVEKNKIEVFVNGVNSEIFYPRDKKESRKKFNLTEDDFAISFVGQFIKRKGIHLLNEALKEIKSVKALYAGSGDIPLTEDFIKFCGKLQPDELPYLLSASDLFVFPSVNEGCSNAILEAIACGVPIIAHDAEFNYDILDERNSILIDATSVENIKESILYLKNNKELRKKMSLESLKKVKNLTIEKRAKNILKWMENVLDENK